MVFLVYIPKEAGLKSMETDDGAIKMNYEADSVIKTYLITSGLYTLATAMIWGVNTLFLLDAGLDIFQIMLINSLYSIGQVLFEIPTGVIADTLGRRISFLSGIAILMVSTLLYLGSATLGWGIPGFAVGSVLLGLGYTFQTGAVDAWLVDALDELNYKGRKDEVFARGGFVFGVAMLIGTISGGFLGQANLALPYIARAIIMAISFLVTLRLMHDIGFKTRPLKINHFAAETRTIFKAGVRFGWRNPVVRPLLFASAIQGSFFMYFFYAAQPYLLFLLGRPDLIWVSGAFAAMFGLSSMIGNLCVKLITRTSWGDSASRVLTAGAVIFSILAFTAGMSGFISPEEGSIAGFSLLVGSMFLIGVTMGIIEPIGQGYINAHIPSKHRATILSVNSFFHDAGNTIGQPAFGWISRAVSIPVAYIVGSAVTVFAAPLFARSGREAETCIGVNAAGECMPPGSRSPMESLEI